MKEARISFRQGDSLFLQRNHRELRISQMQAVSVFRARSYTTALLTSAAIILMLFAAALAAEASHPNGAAGVVLIPVLIVAFFAAIVPTMKYTVTDSEVILSCGPFHWRIPVHQIRSMVEKDLGWLPLSEGWKIPGYALFKIRYRQIGSIRMCATALTKRILIIDTGTHLWGITPADLDGFVTAANRSRDRKEGQTVAA
jgi:hypothetical protein